MGKYSDELNDNHLVESLLELGRHIDFPPTPNIVPALLAREKVTGFLERTTTHHVRRGVRGLIFASVLIVSSFVAIMSDQPRRSPGYGSVLGLGQGVSLAYAQAHSPFHILAPTGLSTPDAVYLHTSPKAVYLLYRTSHGGLARGNLLVAEFPSKEMLLNARNLKSFAMRVPIGASMGYVVRSKAPKVRLLTGRFRIDVHSRGAGTTLLWQKNGITVVLESNLSQRAAVAVAASAH
ncbi:MAG: hypothetical protein ACRDFX_01635 [Chloroflexota bacterium]